MKLATPVLLAGLLVIAATPACEPDCEAKLTCGKYPNVGGMGGTGGFASTAMGGSNVGSGGMGAGGGVVAPPRIFAGSRATCVVRSGELWCWGSTLLAGLEVQPLPALIPLDVAEVSLGPAHACAHDGVAMCWGGNAHGQLGNGTTVPSDSAVAVVGLPPAAAIAVGATHTCARTKAGGAFCWGDNGAKQLTGGVYNSVLPVLVFADGEGVTDIAVGSQHSCAVRNAAVWCWGNNLDKQVDPQSTDDLMEQPLEVAGLPSVATIGAGGAHTCALTPAGAVWCWGGTMFGQLAEQGPAVVGGLPPAARLAVGEFHSCAQAMDGAVWCWGTGGAGQLGNGSGATSTTPVQVDGLPCEPIDIAAGSQHSCAVCADATIACWGGNSTGAVGVGGLGGQYNTPQVLAAF